MLADEAARKAAEKAALETGLAVTTAEKAQLAAEKSKLEADKAAAQGRARRARGAARRRPLPDHDRPGERPRHRHGPRRRPLRRRQGDAEAGRARVARQDVGRPPDAPRREPPGRGLHRLDRLGRDEQGPLGEPRQERLRLPDHDEDRRRPGWPTRATARPTRSGTTPRPRGAPRTGASRSPSHAASSPRRRAATRPPTPRRLPAKPAAKKPAAKPAAPAKSK